jgi:hypothetical protein
MSTTYTANLKLGQPAVADRNWDQALNANAALLDALAPIGGLCVTPLEVPSVSLNVRVASGRYQKRDGTVGSFAGAASFALGPGQTSALYLTDSGVLTALTNGYPTTAHVRLATVVTGPATITNLSDDRVVCSVVGTDALPYLPLAGGALNDGANVALGTVAGTQIGTSATQKLGFWNAPPVARPAPFTQGYTVSTRTLASYTAIVEAATFSGIATGQAGQPYAQAADLNNLRVGYENLRQFTENVAQVLNALINDHRSTGLTG